MTAGHSGQVFSSSKGQLPPPGAERGKSGGGGGGGLGCGAFCCCKISKIVKMPNDFSIFGVLSLS
jgi:hypothetical protein